MVSIFLTFFENELFFNDSIVEGIFDQLDFLQFKKGSGRTSNVSGTTSTSVFGVPRRCEHRHLRIRRRSFG